MVSGLVEETGLEKGGTNTRVVLIWTKLRPSPLVYSPNSHYHLALCTGRLLLSPLATLISA